MTPDQKLQKHPDWLAGKRFGHSLKKLLNRYPEGAPDRVAAAALIVEEGAVAGLLEKVMEKLRSFAKRSL